MRQTKRLSMTAMLALAAFAVACNGPTNDPNDCDFFMSAGFTSGQPASISTDVACPLPVTMDWTVDVDVLAQGGASNPPPPGTLDTFKVDHYEVTYRNLRTGGTRVGVDVPRPYSFVVPFIGATVPASFDFEGFEVLTGQQKVEPPLSDSSFYAAGPVDLEATITVFGYPVIDPGRVCSTMFKYQIAVYQGPGC